MEWVAGATDHEASADRTFRREHRRRRRAGAAARRPDLVRSVVSRGGRPDLAGDALKQVTAPTMLIVGGYDDAVLVLNEQAKTKMTCEVSLKVVPRADASVRRARRARAGRRLRLGVVLGARSRPSDVKAEP